MRVFFTMGLIESAPGCASFYYFKHSGSRYPLLQNPHFGNISPYSSGSDNFEKNCFRHFFLCYFTIFTGDGNTNYIVLLIVSRLSIQIQMIISSLLIVMGKPVRNTFLGIVKHDWTLIVC